MTHKKRADPQPTAGRPSRKGRALSLPTPDTVARDVPDTRFKFQDAFPFPGVVVVLGFQGEGKSSLAYWLMDEYHTLSQGETTGAVFRGSKRMAAWLPKWVSRPQTLQETPENAVVLFDEASQIAHARRSPSKANLDLANMAGLARQRNQLLLIVTHHTRKLDLLDLAEAKRVIYKRPSEGQVMLERREVKPFTARALKAFAAANGDSRKKAYVVDLERLRFGMVPVQQAPWWRDELSTAMKNLVTG